MAVTRWAVVGAVVLAAPFLAGGIALGWQAAILPEVAGRLALARLLGAALFSFGFAIALMSSAVALAVKAVDRRVLAAAGLLLGCSHIALGIVVRRTIEDAAMNTDASLAPVIVPILLWSASIWLALKSARMASKKPEEALPDTVEQAPSEEQRPLLFPP